MKSYDDENYEKDPNYYLTIDYRNYFAEIILYVGNKNYMEKVKSGQEKLIKGKIPTFFQAYNKDFNSGKLKMEDISKRNLAKIPHLNKIVERLNNIREYPNQSQYIKEIEALYNKLVEILDS